MATPQHDPSTQRQRRGPRQRLSYAVTADRSEAYRAFRAHTAGLTRRLPLGSMDAMRAGTQRDPFSLVGLYLDAGRRIALPKEWAVGFVVWVEAQVHALWPMEATGTQELERRAMCYENADNLAEHALLLRRECRSALRARRDTLAREIAADTLLLARYDRELAVSP